jgi:UDP-N-acetylglucosamine/UDP-N-acetylgalactosamine diphosphorylase
MEELKKSLIELRQDHILEQIPELTDSHPMFLQLKKLDLKSSIGNFESAKTCTISDRDDSKICPIDKVIDLKTLDDHSKKSIYDTGIECIRESKVAAVILSGGQGTRLGFAGPKGMYHIGLLSGKSIFQIHVERITKIRSLAKRISGDLPSIPIYIMTSEMNDTIIKDYFLSKNYFGYPPVDVFFFEQGLEPCLTFDGKVIIESQVSLSLAPDGNGGMQNVDK